MFGKKIDNDAMYALGDRLKNRDLEAARQYLRLFRDRSDLDPVMSDLTRAVALVVADTMIGEDYE